MSRGHSRDYKGATMNLKELKELIDMLKNTDITEIEIERSGVKVRVRKGGDVSFHPVMPRMEYPPASIVAPAVAEPEKPAAAVPAPAPVPAAALSNQIRVTSPIVGTFYRSSSPEKPPYVEVGDIVKKGQVLCIIEAMKLMNEIESETAGKVVQIIAENGQPVEYGQPLFVIEPA
jgi:oxaloacetate decarboxylase alpha subunit